MRPRQKSYGEGVKAAFMKAKISGTARSFDIDPKPSKYRVDIFNQ